MSAEFVRFLKPREDGYMPMIELLPDTQREVYEASGEYLSELPETSQPDLRRMLIRLDDGREVAHLLLRNCISLEEYYAHRSSVAKPRSAFLNRILRSIGAAGYFYG